MGSLQTEKEEEVRMFNFENFTLITHINKIILYKNEMVVCSKNYIKHKYNIRTKYKGFERSNNQKM